MLASQPLTRMAAARPLFKKLLVANRGEIACRVMRTAHRMGIETVAVYSEPDSRAPHVALAGQSVCVGSAASADSYLRIDRILDAIASTGAEAVHPGYGFLSENAAFSEAVEAAGVAFVGPAAFAINAMGDKIESKRLAAEAGVTTIPGFEGVIADADEAARVASDVGFPVMIKASAGGGGKGMRIAWDEAEARQAFGLSQREAAASFGDDRIFIERYVEKPRHIEIQLIADTHGNVVYLPERECSVQRRNQKVVEEAPAPHFSEATWRRMGEEAVQLAKAVGYRSAGTVEFLVDARDQHYFLEMNTRLQVEHPVTECVAGIDLVEEMIRVAAGEKLSIAQADVRRIGWAIESRVYAEDPLRGFLPSIGTLSAYRPPDEAACNKAADLAMRAEGEGGLVRVDDGCAEGGEISVHYDPMIAKLITHGRDREHARQLMIAALERYVIHGSALRHNLNFLRTIMGNDTFIAGKITTGFIPDQFPDGYRGHQLSASERIDLIAAAAALEHAAAGQASSGSGTAAAAAPYSVRIEGLGEGDGDDHSLAVMDEDCDGLPVGPGSELRVASTDDAGEGWSRTLRLVQSGLGPSGILEAEMLGDASDATPATLVVQVQERLPLGWRLCAFGTSFTVLARPPHYAALGVHMKPPPPSPFAGSLLSPMPGTLHSVAVEVGERVALGQELCVVEAMKMQNVLVAERDGVVSELYAAPGDTLAADQPIVGFEK